LTQHYRQTHATAVWQTLMDRSKHPRSTQDRHGPTEHLSAPNQCRSDGSMRMRTSERDGRAFSSSDAPNGQHSARRCSSVPKHIEATYLST